MKENDRKNPPKQNAKNEERVRDLPDRKSEKKDDQVKGGGKANFQDISLSE